MPFAHEPLDASLISDGAKKVLAGPPPMKMMAARGLAPLKPVDLAVVIYSLAQDGDESLKGAALKTAGELPEKVLGGALTDGSLPPLVLDFFALKILGKPALIEAILLNKNTADETVTDMVPRLGEKDLEMVAQNEQRLLRHPPLIGALYMNAKARMSTVDRCVELAVRNNVTVPGVPSWDEVVAAVLGTAKDTKPKVTGAALDAAFSQVANVAIGDAPVSAAAMASVSKGTGSVVEVTDAVEPEALEALNEEETAAVEEEKKKIPIEQLPVPSKIRLATLGNSFARAILIRDTNKQVALAAIRSPGMTDNEAVKFSANRSLGDEIIRVISNTKEWTKLYQVKVNLVNNPKCPLPTAMRMLPFLRDREMKNLARSKGIASALAVQAKKLLNTKGK